MIHKIVIGNNIPDRLPKDFVPVNDLILERIQGMYGEVHIHLCGRWWEVISPDMLQKVLENNLELNRIPPIITVSS